MGVNVQPHSSLDAPGLCCAAAARGYEPIIGRTPADRIAHEQKQLHHPVSGGDGSRSATTYSPFLGNKFHPTRFVGKKNKNKELSATLEICFFVVYYNVQFYISMTTDTVSNGCRMKNIKQPYKQDEDDRVCSSSMPLYTRSTKQCCQVGSDFPPNLATLTIGHISSGCSHNCTTRCFSFFKL